MYRLRGRFHFIYVVIDFLCIAGVFYTCYLWRYNPNLWSYLFHPGSWEKLSFLALPEYTSIFLLWSALTLFSLQRFNLFTTNRRLSILGESWQVFKALIYATIPTAAAVFILQYKVYSRLVFISSWIGVLIVLIAWRIAKRLYIRYTIKKGKGLIKVLLVGAGQIGEAVLGEISKYEYLGLEVVGVLSKERMKGEEVFGLKILGGYSDLEEVIRKYYIDEVFVSQYLSPDELSKFVLTGNRLGCGIKIVPECSEHIYGDFRAYNLGFLHFLEYGFKKLHGTDLYKKRVFDTVLSFLLIMILAPISLLLMLLVKIEDKGPIFYSSKRVGRKGKIFDFYKFRSMITDADKMKGDLEEKSEVTGPIFKIKKDPRITKVGRFMRRFSLDELPQLWNVLKGDMSLVGPRPPIPGEVNKYDSWQLRRLEVKPGITCMWQVRGRSNLGFYKWVKWDLWYIDNWSFWLDIRILFWTIPAVLKGEGAY